MNSLDYWNNHAVNKTFTTTFAIERFRALVPVNARVLDVGCGYGRVLAELWSAGYRNLLGLDPVEALIRRGRGLFPHLPLTVQGNPPALDVADRSVDAALLCAVLTCVVDDAGAQRLLDEIRRVLRPGGVVYCSTGGSPTNTRPMASSNCRKEPSSDITRKTTSAGCLPHSSSTASK